MSVETFDGSALASSATFVSRAPISIHYLSSKREPSLVHDIDPYVESKREQLDPRQHIELTYLRAARSTPADRRQQIGDSTLDETEGKYLPDDHGS